MKHDPSRPRLLLHAGMPKTGTATIQRTLSQAAWNDVLKSRGIRYLTGAAIKVNHGKYFNAMRGRPNWLTAEAHEALLRDFGNAIQDAGIGLSDAHTMLISAESVFDLTRDEGGLSRAHDFLRRFFRDISVTMYVREPLAYVSSRIQQSLKTGYALRPAVVNAIAGCDSAAVIARLQDRFGKANVQLRPFDPLYMESGDVVTDFCVNVLGLERSPQLASLLIAKRDGNFALSAEILEGLLALYRERNVTPENFSTSFAKMMGTVRWAGRQFSVMSVANEDRERVLEETDAARARICDQLGFDCFPSYQAPDASLRGSSPAEQIRVHETNIGLLHDALARVAREHDIETERSEPECGGAGSCEEAAQRVVRLLGQLYDLHQMLDRMDANQHVSAS